MTCARDPPAIGATVTANLLAPLLTVWARRLREAGVSPERVIASGLLAHEADAVAGEFAPLGLREVDRRLGGEWAALLLARIVPRPCASGAWTSAPPNPVHRADAFLARLPHA